MIRRFQDHLRSTSLIPKGAKLLVGYSGGADSTCLLHLLHLCGRDVVAGHLHHGQRREADEEMRRCREFAESIGIPFASGQADVPLIASQMKVGLEEAGRHARYEFFRRAAAELGCDIIATAHTLDDDIETVLLNIVRGCGLGGLAGIPARRAKIVRPMLEFSRMETRAYCAEHGLWFHDDPANDDISFARARIRQRVVPEIEAINPSVRQAILRLSSLASEEDSFLDAAAAAALEQCEIEMNGPLRFLTLDREVWLERGKLAHLPVVLLRRAIRLTSHVLGAELDHDQTRAIVEGLRSTQSGSITAEFGRVVVEWKPSTVSVRSLDVPPFLKEPLSMAGEVHGAGWKMTAENVDPANYQRSRGSLEVVIDADSIRGGLELRRGEHGAEMRPLNMDGKKKLADILADGKLTEAARRTLPVVCDSEGPVWVPSIALADRVKISERTRRATLLRFGPTP